MGRDGPGSPSSPPRVPSPPGQPEQAAYCGPDFRRWSSRPPRGRMAVPPPLGTGTRGLPAHEHHPPPFTASHRRVAGDADGRRPGRTRGRRRSVVVDRRTSSASSGPLPPGRRRLGPRVQPRHRRAARRRLRLEPGPSVLARPATWIGDFINPNVSIAGVVSAIAVDPRDGSTYVAVTGDGRNSKDVRKYDARRRLPLRRRPRGQYHLARRRRRGRRLGPGGVQRTRHPRVPVRRRHADGDRAPLGGHGRARPRAAEPADRDRRRRRRQRLRVRRRQP